MKTNTPVKNEFPRINEGMKIGQIRRLETNGKDAKLVVIYRVNAISATCDVILLDHNIDNAIKNDYVSNIEDHNFRFGHVVMPDFVGNVDLEILKASQVYAEVCQFCISSIGPKIFGTVNDQITLPFEHNCYLKGDFKLRILSEEWIARSNSFAEFFESCNLFLSYDEFLAKKEAVNLYYANNSLEKILTESSQQYSFEEIKHSIEKNPYAKMLVRC